MTITPNISGKSIVTDQLWIFAKIRCRLLLAKNLQSENARRFPADVEIHADFKDSSNREIGAAFRLNFA
jgi:hypothetical protein